MSRARGESDIFYTAYELMSPIGSSSEARTNTSETASGDGQAGPLKPLERRSKVITKKGARRPPERSTYHDDLSPIDSTYDPIGQSQEQEYEQPTPRAASRIPRPRAKPVESTYENIAIGVNLGDKKLSDNRSPVRRPRNNEAVPVLRDPPSLPKNLAALSRQVSASLAVEPHPVDTIAGFSGEESPQPLAFQPAAAQLDTPVPKAQKLNALQPVTKQKLQPPEPLIREKSLRSKRLSRHVNPTFHEQLQNVILRQDEPITSSNRSTLAGLLSPSPVLRSQPVIEETKEPIFPGYLKTGSIDFDARVYRCNEKSRTEVAPQSIVAGEDNFACAIVNHLGGYLRLLRSQATLFIPPHAILGDPEPIVIFFMPKNSQVGYHELANSLEPDQFLVSPIMYVGKPGIKCNTVDLVVSFPLEENLCHTTQYDVLTVKGFDTSFTCRSPENAKWRILAPGHDYFFTVYGGRGVLMVGNSAFYVVRATRSKGGSQKGASKECPSKKLRVALFGRSFPDMGRAKLHVVFCKNNDIEVERVVQLEEREGYRKLDHARILTVQTSSGQPVWVTFSHLTSSNWRLQTNPTAKFAISEVLDYSDQCPPSVTFALEDTTTEDQLHEAFVQCMVVVHQGPSSDYQADGVPSFIHLIGDISVAYSRSGQFHSCSLGRASGRKLPTLPVPPMSNQQQPNIPSIAVAPLHNKQRCSTSSGASSMASPRASPRESPRASITTSSCPSLSPPAIPSSTSPIFPFVSSSRNSIMMSGSYGVDDATTKAKFDDLFISYVSLAEMCLLLQDYSAEARGRGWRAFASKIGLTSNQVQGLYDRFSFRSPQAILHFFFGTSTVTGTAASSLEKTRAIFARLLSIFQELRRDDLVAMMRRELGQIDRVVDRYSKFLFEGQQFESKLATSVSPCQGRVGDLGKGKAGTTFSSAGSQGNRHSFSDGDIPNLPDGPPGFIRSHLWDFMSWVKSKSPAGSKVKGKAEDAKSTRQKNGSTPNSPGEEFYEVPAINFSVFEEQHYDVPATETQTNVPDKGAREERTAKAEMNQYF